MKTAYGVLALVALEAVRLTLSERQHRQRLALDVARMHGEWLSDVVSDPDARALWATTGEGTGDDSPAMIHVNRGISFLALKYHVGLLNDQSLRTNANWVMGRPAARAYWGRHGVFRLQEAESGFDYRFNAAMTAAYKLHLGLASA